MLKPSLTGLKYFFLVVMTLLLCISSVNAYEETWEYMSPVTFSDSSGYIEGWHIFSSSSYYPVKVEAAPVVTNGQNLCIYQYGKITMTEGEQSDYWSFTIKGTDLTAHNFIKMTFYDENDIAIAVESVEHFSDGNWGPGFHELVRNPTSGIISQYTNGVYTGSMVDTYDSTIFYPKSPTTWDFRANCYDIAYIRIDDISTTGYLISPCVESLSPTTTTSDNDDINVSYTIKTYDSGYTGKEFKAVVKYFSPTGVETVGENVIKAAGDDTTFGYTNFSRASLTDNDTNFGMYTFYMTADDAIVTSDYLFFSSGDFSTIVFENDEIILDTTEEITYAISSSDFDTYTYNVRIYDYTGEIFSQAVTEASGTVDWDTEDASLGTVYAVLTRTHKSTSVYEELTYDVASIVETLFIEGNTYDLLTGEILPLTNISFKQGSLYYNITSDANGSYELEDISIDLELFISASRTNYTYDNFSVTPLKAQLYTIDLYLTNTSTNFTGNTTIFGQTYSYPYHQPVPNATVNITNNTWYNTTTSNSWGLYMFNNMPVTGTQEFTVNGTKTDFIDSDNYTVEIIADNGSQQNILMKEIYTLTIRAKDSVSQGYITSFDVLKDNVVTSTTAGIVTYTGLTYGLEEITVSSSDYYAGTTSVLIDSTKTEIFTLDRIPDETEYYMPHYVKFTVLSIWGVKYANVTVNVYNASTPTEVVFTGTTGTDGAVAFELDQDIRYKITFESDEITNKIIYMYPKDEHYYIIVSYGAPEIIDGTEFEYENIDVDVKWYETNGTIHVFYEDYLNDTSSLMFYVNQTNISDIHNQITILSFNTFGNKSDATHIFNLTNYTGQEYIVSVQFTHGEFGDRKYDYGASFGQVIEVIDDVFSPFIKGMFGVFMLIFLALLFGARSAEQGGLIVAIFAGMLHGIGWFDYFGNGTALTAGIGLAIVMMIAANMSKKSKQEGI